MTAFLNFRLMLEADIRPVIRNIIDLTMQEHHRLSP